MSENKTLAQTVYTEIKRRILSKEYNANDHVSEKSIAAQLNVSKTPVREALGQLCLEGYIMHYPSFGYIIKDLSYQEAKDISELRFILESAAVRIIVKYCTDEDIRGLYEYLGVSESNVTDGYGKNTIFHWQLGKLTKNAYLSDYIRQLAMSIARPSQYLDAGDEPRQNNDLHKRIVDALCARDADAAIGILKMDVIPGGYREL